MEHIQGVVILEISDINQGGGIDFLDPIYFSDTKFFQLNSLLSIDRMFI